MQFCQEESEEERNKLIIRQTFRTKNPTQKSILLLCIFKKDTHQDNKKVLEANLNLIQARTCQNLQTIYSHIELINDIREKIDFEFYQKRI